MFLPCCGASRAEEVCPKIQLVEFPELTENIGLNIIFSVMKFTGNMGFLLQMLDFLKKHDDCQSKQIPGCLISVVSLLLFLYESDGQNVAG